jgi:DNA polymerase
MTEPSRQALLELVHARVRECTLCRLARSRRLAVPGEGPLDARLLLVGEAPGEAEDREGFPFVGAAGQRLSSLLDAAVLTRPEVFITNIVKCRPLKNREPREDEMTACRPYLLAQLALVRPQAVGTLGRIAGRALIGPELNLSEDHGRPFTRLGIPFVPLYHPIAMQTRETMEKDMRRVRRLLERAG